MKRKIYLHALLKLPDSPPEIGIVDADMSSFGYGPVFETREIEFEPPSQKELIARQVAVLTAERDKVYTDAARKAAEINERLEKFLAITNSPSQETSS